MTINNLTGRRDLLAQAAQQLGPTLRDAGMTEATDHAPAWKVAQIDALIARANATGQPWSANTIRASLPDTQSQGLVGARVRAAAMRRPREMNPVGYVPSDLPSTHAHPVRQWLGVTTTHPQDGAA